MGKLPIIPRRGTCDNIRATRREEKAVVIGGTGVGADTTCASDGIADNAAADRYQCVFARNVDRIRAVRSISIDDQFITKVCTRESHSMKGALSDSVCRKHRQTGVSVGVVATTQLRRNTWHVSDRLSKVGNSAEVDRTVDAEDIDTFIWLRCNISESDNKQNDISNTPGALSEHWPYARTAGDEQGTCCTIDVASFVERRTQERAANPNSVRRVVKRWNRRGVLSAGSRSIEAPNDISNVERTSGDTDIVTNVDTHEKWQNHFAIDVSSYKRGNVLSTDAIDIPFRHTDVGSTTVRSSVTAPETRDSIDSGLPKTECQHILTGTDFTVDIASLHQSGSTRRLIEIGIVDSTYRERRCLPEDDTSVRSSGFFSTVRVPTKVGDSRAKRIKTNVCYGLSSWRISLVFRTLLLGLLTTNLLCDAVLGAPSMSNNLEAVGFEDTLRKEEAMSKNVLTVLGEDERQIIRRSIVQGLGLQRIPDSSKANVSQAEYERAHRVYLKNMQLSHDKQKSGKRLNLHVVPHTEHRENRTNLTARSDCKQTHYLYFPFEAADEDTTIDHASLRFFLEGSHNGSLDLEVLIYQRTAIFSQLLVRKKIVLADPKESRWVEFDITEAVLDWVENKLENQGLELRFFQNGQPTQRRISQTTLNIFTTSESHTRVRRSTPDQILSLHRSRRIKCSGQNKRCCRHELNVMFKDLEGFEFVVFPKGFDTGYCKGRCPPRYNPAHHHALLQSLLWKEEPKKVPKPCCAPSKLDQLMIVYYDENDSSQLKVAYWKNIQVLECACS